MSLYKYCNRCEKIMILTPTGHCNGCGLYENSMIFNPDLDNHIMDAVKYICPVPSSNEAMEAWQTYNMGRYPSSNPHAFIEGYNYAKKIYAFDLGGTFHEIMARMGKYVIRVFLAKHGGHVSNTAKELKIDRKTVYNILKK